MKLASLVGSLLFLAVAAAAADPITIGHTETLHSTVLGEDRVIHVSLPPGYEVGDTHHPVLYLLGGGHAFHHLTGTVRTLAHVDLAPSLIVIGITQSSRTRDLTPEWTSPDPPASMAHFIARAGGAENFTRFLAEELIPHVEREYRTAPFRLLAGHSLGGLFTLHTLLVRPETFDGYLAVSPSASWDEGAVVRWATDFVAREPGDLPKFLYLSLASEQDETRTHFLELVHTLEAVDPESLDWAHRTFPEDDHGSAALAGYHRGLESVFSGWRMPGDVMEQTIEGLDRHHATLSARFGYAIPVPEATIHAVGYRALVTGQVEEAIRVLTENTVRHPNSPGAFHALGQALEATGRPVDALARYEEAVALAKANGDPNLSAYETARDTLKSAAR